MIKQYPLITVISLIVTLETFLYLWHTEKIVRVVALLKKKKKKNINFWKYCMVTYIFLCKIDNVFLHLFTIFIQIDLFSLIFEELATPEDFNANLKRQKLKELSVILKKTYFKSFLITEANRMYKGSQHLSAKIWDNNLGCYGSKTLILLSNDSSVPCRFDGVSFIFKIIIIS